MKKTVLLFVVSFALFFAASAQQSAAEIVNPLEDMELLTNPLGILEQFDAFSPENINNVNKQPSIDFDRMSKGFSKGNSAIISLFDHYTQAFIVNGKPDYGSSGVAAPAFGYMAFFTSGLTPTNEVAAAAFIPNGIGQYLNASTLKETSFNNSDGAFYLIPAGQGIHYLSDPNSAGDLVVFVKNSERTLSNQPYLVMGSDKTSYTGVIPTIHSTATQLNSEFVPYVELYGNNSSSTLTGALVRFVHPSATATPLRQSSTYDVASLSFLNCYDKDSNLLHSETLDTSYSNGSILETSVPLSKSVNLNDLAYIEIGYLRLGSIMSTTEVESGICYVWQFFTRWDGSSGSGDIGGGGGGCSTGGFFALALLTAAFRFSRKKR